MIDFKSIRYTTSGLECYYLGQRISGDQVIHRFAVVNPAGEKFAYYNDQGERIEYRGPGVWVVQNDGHQIIASPKIVEVTTWDVYWLLEIGKVWVDKYQIEPSISHLKSHELEGTKRFLKIVKVTESIEVTE